MLFAPFFSDTRLRKTTPETAEIGGPHTIDKIIIFRNCQPATAFIFLRSGKLFDWVHVISFSRTLHQPSLSDSTNYLLA
jgi:hypothetical protein